MIRGLTKIVLICAVLTVCSTSPAFAQAWSDPRTLESVQVSNYQDNTSGETVLELKATTSWGGDGCTSDTVRRAASGEVTKEMVSIALAAYLSGKTVRAFINNTGGTCWLLRLEIGTY